MVYVTHDQTEALTFADKVVVMYDGEIVQIGTPAELFEKPEAHLRRLFHRLAGHECPAGDEVDGSSAFFGRSDHRPGIAAPKPSPEGAEDRTRHPAGIHPLDRARACRSRSQGRGYRPPASSRAARSGQLPSIDRDRRRSRDPERTAHIRFDPAASIIYADSWRVGREG
jgi:hypothetical protein